MKKIIFSISIIFTLLSCSSNSSDDESSNNYQFHPPTWLQGTWAKNFNGSNEVERTYKFLSNNIFEYQGGTPDNAHTIIDYNEYYGLNVSSSLVISEENINNKYKITFKNIAYGQTIITTQYFTRLTPTTFIHNDDGSLDYGWVFTKIQ